MINILVVEDDKNLRNIISRYLNLQKYHVVEAENGSEALEKMSEHHIDLVVTDIMMPIMDGHTFAYKIRQMNAELPLLMLTALDQFEEKEKGFSSGVDDYMVKPLNLSELNLRIQALLRRYKIMKDHKLEIGNVVLDEHSLSLSIDKKAVSVTNKEFQLLFKLLSYPNKIFTRDQLMDAIWGFDSDSYDRTVDTHIKKIRQHVITDAFEIITVRGLGYKAVIK